MTDIKTEFPAIAAAAGERRTKKNWNGQRFYKDTTTNINNTNNNNNIISSLHGRIRLINLHRDCRRKFLCLVSLSGPRINASESFDGDRFGCGGHFFFTENFNKRFSFGSSKMGDINDHETHVKMRVCVCVDIACGRQNFLPINSEYCCVFYIM